jgi:hypothetical protein
MAGENQGLESLKVWRKSMDFAVDVCQNILPLFPAEEKWALSSQLRRAVYSISANIAEAQWLKQNLFWFWLNVLIISRGTSIKLINLV